MIRKFDTNDRRILKFPAVRPCESVSPTILVTSLVDLCQSISNFRYKTFPTQKKISREIFRKIDILFIFFLEIRENCQKFPNSLILCLSELHFTLQKIQFLLQDFTREGSRLYILMKSQIISNQFRVLIRSIADSLDIVQLKSLGINSEVKELVELLSNQSRKSKLETDPSDEWAIERVMFMLRQFENRLEPERVSIKWVLDYLGIKCWIDCNSEVMFLENELSSIEDDEIEFSLMSDLLGFMCYCRGVIFDNEQIIRQNETRLVDGGLIRVLNPEDFRCPISLELMMDPVTISTGQTYDRVSILKWLNAGHLLCPKTGEKLSSSEFVPNSALKKLIHGFCEENGVSMSITKPEKKNPNVKCSLGYKESIRMLAQFLAGRLSYGTDEQKNKAAYEIRLLTKSSVFNRVTLIEFGNVAPLLDLLTSNNANTQENAIAALLKLAKHRKGLKAIIEEGGLMLVILVLRHGLKPESKQIAAATIFYFSSVEKYRKLIGSTREAIPGLLELVTDGTITGKKNAMAAIYGLLLYDDNHRVALESDIVPTLLNLISTVQRSDILADALSILAALADKTEGSTAILKASALNTMLGLVKSSISRAGKESCVSILLSLCRNGGARVISDVAREAGIMPPLYSVVTDGGCHGSKKARTLIGMLQQHRESSSSNFGSYAAVRKERFGNLV
ncbi:hypothetical protein RND81_10G226200 [Saponaria officinalis]|uniref:RING-type E3 ubiquitin transferase n=1 Tax=Saponaria officinalis TaxID=3572 RepID=A0AAW1I670_SAPOF